MEKFFKYLTFSLFAALIVFASCGGDDDDDNNDDSGPDALDLVVEDLIGSTWVLTEGGATLEAVGVEGWDGFTITITGDRNSLSYNTSNSADPAVWPTSGTWSFIGDDGRKVERSDMIEIDVTASDTNLTLGFDIVEGRTNGIVGRWSFRMEAQ